jgi:tRNA (cmo5U34)-methyltransferase
MPKQDPKIVFDEERAASYDHIFEKIAPMRDALHLLTRLVFSELPSAARILCVGAGTGAEILYLAEAFPQWRFTAVEPAAPMLAICRRRAEEAGIASRCTFHEGYLESLPATDPFDAATCLLVSHFLLEKDERGDFFRQIAGRLRPGGYLVSADLASDMNSPAYRSLLGTWKQMMRHCGVPAEQAEQSGVPHGRDVAVLPPHEVAAIIASSGFEAPTLFLQTLLIHAWYARRS